VATKWPLSWLQETPRMMQVRQGCSAAKLLLLLLLLLLLWTGV
jgi:hypothetical protein